MAIEHDVVTSIHRGGYVANSDPGAVGANRFWTDTTTTPHVLKIRNAANTAWVQIGELVTGSNVGTSGAEVFKQKTGQALEFRKIKGNVNVEVAQSANDVSISVVESLLDKPQTQGFYKEDFIVSFAGATDPIVIANPISQYGGCIFTRDNPGVYLMTFNAVLPTNGVVVHITPGTYAAEQYSFTARHISPTEIVIESYVMDTGVQDDAVVTNCSISVTIVTTVPFLDTAAGFWGWFHPEKWSGTDSGWFNAVLNPVAVELLKDGTDVGQTGTLNTYDTVQFSLTTNDGRLLSTMAPNTAIIREIFVVMQMREATFSNFGGIITGPDTSLSPPLVGDPGTTKFVDFSYTGQEYRLDNTLYANNDMQAPMNAWGIVHVRYSVGWGFTEVQFGSDRDFVGRFAEVDMAEVMMFSALQPQTTVDQIYEYLTTKFNL